jgi:hypothetical protein
MGWFSSLDELPEFCRRLRHHWAAAVMGGTLLSIVLFVWSLLGSVPHWAVGFVLVGALLFSGYFTWRDEFLALRKYEQQPPQLRAYVNGMVGEIHHHGPRAGDSYHWIYTDLRVSILNAGPPTIIERWTLELPTGECLSMRERNLNESLTLDERTRIENLLELSREPLDTGGRKELLLTFVLEDIGNSDRDGDGRARFTDGREVGWALSFCDVAGRTHKVALVRNGLFIESIDGLDTARQYGVKSVHD